MAVEVPKKKHKGMPPDLDKMDQRWAALLNNDIEEMGHDVTFLVGIDKKEKISCHKLFLAAASPVFQKMLFGPLKSGNTIIEITDVYPQAFKNILQFAYLRTLEVEVIDAVKTMFAADKYQIPELVSRCSDFLSQNLNPENAVTIFQAASILNVSNLKEKSFDFVLEHFMEIIPTSGFLHFTADDLCEILKSDELNVDSEVDAFEAVVRWGKEKNCKNKLSEVLANVIKHVRFPLMDVATFLEKVESKGVLRDKDAFNILKFLNLESEKRKQFKDLNFSQKWRNGHLLTFNTNLDFYSDNNVLSVERFCVQSFPEALPDPNLSIFLEEVELVCDTKGSSDEIELDLKLKKCPNGPVITIPAITLQKTVSKTKSVLINTRIDLMLPSRGYINQAYYCIQLTIKKGILGIPAQPSTGNWETASLKYKRGSEDSDIKFEYTSRENNILFLKFRIRREN